MSDGSETLRVGRREVRVSSASKPLFTKPEVTKLDLARYYASVGEAMLPHVRDRPLALETFPDGIDGEQRFYMKQAPKHFPDWIERVTVEKRGGTLTQAVACEPATLVYLAGQNVVTPHVWLSRVDEPRRPDRLTIDLDPSPGGRFADVRAIAREAGARLSAAGLVTFAMVTGSRGIHVVCPLRRDREFPEVHGYARRVAEAMVADSPERVTLEWKRDDRGTKIYLDVNRIAYAQHAVAPYGVRARRGAPVAMPIHWDELSDPKLKPDRWTTRNAVARLESEGDPWRGMGRRARKLPIG
ncbi:ATP-dependent DNA ligase [Thermoleophilia bacterium SCSIO 60948]|nr:ATP-dependent DNA ligase [Thermoleophilia bacterium SCSIO 60948]